MGGGDGKDKKLEGSLGFCGYFVLNTLGAGAIAVVVVEVFSSIGNGEETIARLAEMSAGSNTCFASVFGGILFLYQLDFFWPPHIPGQYCVLWQGGIKFGAILVGVLAVVALAGCFLTADEYPWVPFLLTTFLTPVVILGIRLATRPRLNKESERLEWALAHHEEFKRVPAEWLRGRIEVMQLLEVQERERRTFYKAVQAALLLVGVTNFVVWLVWALSDSDDSPYTYYVDTTSVSTTSTTASTTQAASTESETDNEKAFILWAAPMMVSVAYFSFTFIIGFRIALGSMYAKTDDLSSRLEEKYSTSMHEARSSVSTFGLRRMSQVMQTMMSATTDRHQEEQQKSHIRSSLQRGAAGKQFDALSVRDQEQFIDKHVGYLNQLRVIMMCLGCAIFSLLAINYVVYQLVTDNKNVLLMFQAFLVLLLVFCIVFIYASFRRVWQTMRVWVVDMPLFKMCRGIAKSDWFRAVLVFAFGLVLPGLLAVSMLNQCVRQCRGLGQHNEQERSLLSSGTTSDEDIQVTKEDSQQDDDFDDIMRLLGPPNPRQSRAAPLDGIERSALRAKLRDNSNHSAFAAWILNIKNWSTYAASSSDSKTKVLTPAGLKRALAEFKAGNLPITPEQQETGEDDYELQTFFTFASTECGSVENFFSEIESNDNSPSASQRGTVSQQALLEALDRHQFKGNAAAICSKLSSPTDIGMLMSTERIAALAEHGPKVVVTVDKVTVANAPKPQPKAIPTSCLTQRVSKFVDMLAEWNWLSVVLKTYVVAVGVVIFVLTPLLLNVFLAWMYKILEEQEMATIIAAVFGCGLVLFLLPPVPGAPVYLFGGVLISGKGEDTPPGGTAGYWVWTGVCIAVCWLLKLMACALQQKGIGGLLGGKLWVRQTVGIHKPFIRAIEVVLSRPGLSFGKCMILMGGPDWPTSVLAGVLRLSLLQCEIGTMPIITYIAPLSLTGSFYLKREESQTWKNAGDLMFSITALMTLVYWVAIGWVIQDVFEKQHEHLTRPREEYVDLDWLDYRDAEIANSFVLKLQDVPWPVKVPLLAGCAGCVALGQAFYWVQSTFFGSFAVTDDIDAIKWYGEDGLVRSMGVAGLGGMVACCCCCIFFWCWKESKSKASKEEARARLNATEKEWKEKRREEARQADGVALQDAAQVGASRSVHYPPVIEDSPFAESSFGANSADLMPIDPRLSDGADGADGTQRQSEALRFAPARSQTAPLEQRRAEHTISFASSSALVSSYSIADTEAARPHPPRPRGRVRRPATKERKEQPPPTSPEKAPEQAAEGSSSKADSPESLETSARGASKASDLGSNTGSDGGVREPPGRRRLHKYHSMPVDGSPKPNGRARLRPQNTTDDMTSSTGTSRARTKPSPSPEPQGIRPEVLGKPSDEVATEAAPTVRPALAKLTSCVTVDPGSAVGGDRRRPRGERSAGRRRVKRKPQAEVGEAASSSTAPQPTDSGGQPSRVLKQRCSPGCFPLDSARREP